MLIRETVSEILGLKVNGSEMLYLMDNWRAWCTDIYEKYPLKRKYANLDSIVKEDIESKRHNGGLAWK